MSEASAPLGPQPSPFEPRPGETSPETRLEPSTAPETQPIELPAVAATPTSPGEPERILTPAPPPILAGEPEPVRPEVPPVPIARAFEAESAPATPPPPRARVYEVEATALSAGQARVLSSEAPRAEAIVITPAPVGPDASAGAGAGSASGPTTYADATVEGAGSANPPPPLGATYGIGGGQASVPPTPPPESPWRRRRQHIWSILCHLFLFLTIPTVFLGATLTFLVWQLKGRDSREVEQNGREALNFQINVAILSVLIGLTCVGTPLLPIVWLIAAVYAVIAARAASDGETYRYPYVLKIVTH